MSGHAKTSLDKKKARRALREAPEEDPEFQIAPMVDVLLVLLIFFMSISSTQVLQTTKDVVVPIAADGLEVKTQQNKAIINITYMAQNGTSAIVMNDKTYTTPEELVPLLEVNVRDNPEYVAVVRADKMTQYKFLRNVLAAIGKSKIKNVTFSVTDKEVPKS